MAPRYSKAPSCADLDEIRGFIERGRRNYDLLAKLIYTMCSESDDVKKRVLDAVEHVEHNISESGSDENEDDINESEDDLNESEDDINESEDDINESGEDVHESEGEPIKIVGSATKRKRSDSDSKVKDSPKSKKQNIGSKEKNSKCLNCDALFDPNENEEDSCHYHPGESVLGDFDDNPTCDDIEDDWPSRQTWPNAFDWKCCDGNLEDDLYDGEPCTKGKHRAEGEKLEFATWQVKKLEAL